MNFSMPSFLVGVGTVVGAIALGFGGGVVLTNSAVKETSPPRVERVAHPDVPAAKIVARADAAKADAGVPPDASNPPLATDAAQPPVTVIPMNAQASSVPLATQPVDRPAAASTAPMQQVVARDTDQTNANDVERQRRAERRLQRKKLEAERRAKAQAVAKMRQQQFDVREQQARPELAFEREEDSGFNFFGRPNAPQSAERD